VCCIRFLIVYNIGMEVEVINFPRDSLGKNQFPFLPVSQNRRPFFTRR
jgi:hypothetical protein